MFIPRKVIMQKTKTIFWTKKRNEELIKLYDLGITPREIAIKMGTTTKGVYNQAHRIGLTWKRPTPQDIQSRGMIELPDRIAKALKTRKNLRDLADQFDLAPKKIIEAIKRLEERNILIDTFEDGGFQLAKDIAPRKPRTIDLSKHVEVEYPLGFVTDTHLCSKYERLDVLNALYDRFESYGVERVFHGGNWIDGESRFNKFDIHTHGFEGQLKYFLKNYPQRKNMETEIISGDDHEGWYVQREHIDVGRIMESRAKEIGRNDLIDLGYMESDIEYKQPGGKSTIRVIHAGGGSAYAISYTSQKYAEVLQGGEKPSIVLVGHFHKFDWSYPREIHIIQGGCTCDQTPWMRKKKLQAMVGGCVLWVKQNDIGIFTSVKVEWMPFYDKKFYSYKW